MSICVALVHVQYLLYTDGQAEGTGDVVGQGGNVTTTAKQQAVVILDGGENYVVQLYYSGTTLLELMYK